MIKQLDITQKQSVRYAVDLSIRDEQIRINTAVVKDRIQPYAADNSTRADSVAIVGFGSSLKKTWKQFKKFKYIITCSGSHRFLIDKGITPFAHVEVDPRVHKIELLGEPHPDVIYYPASCCHPLYIQHLLKHNAQVKLWHVFSQDGESDQVLPRGEWYLTGGCDVGMRCMTLARFLGFTDMHIFGMDGCFGEEGSHADKHPNAPPSYAETEYNGKTYRTTPALLESARQVFHELDQLSDVKTKFYGDGLIQAMAKDYQRKPSVVNGLIAFHKPELISEELRELNARLHRDNAAYGIQGGKHADAVKKMLPGLKREDGLPPSILDYGCGKGGLQKALGFPIYEYDPAIPGKDEPPRPADLVACFDVLEHVEPDKLKYVLDDLKRVTKQVGYFIVHIGAAKKTYADGRNTHLIQQDVQWWAKQLGKFFQVGKIVDHGHEIHCVVGPKPQPPPPATIEVETNGIKARFLTPNETTKWRAETLLKKEPITVEWIHSMNPGDVFYDVGANVGGYSILAGVKGLKVYAFEPQADNYALLVQNLRLNGVDPNAYCIALSDRMGFDRLHLSGNDAGGSCHSFGESVGFDLQPRTNGNFHGAVGIPLDELVERGLPKPNHIKIDVDGFEFKVIKGAEKVLSNCAVKSVLVEVNDSLPEHQEMLRYMDELGYSFDPEQVEKAKRKTGPFAGVAEYVFTKVPATERRVKEYLLAALDTAVVCDDPTPYFWIPDALPPDVYDQVVNNFPKKYTPIAKARNVKGYPQRFVGEQTEFWKDLDRALRSGWFKNALCKKFGVESDGLTDETLLIRDLPSYRIGPHTDHPQKVISALFYLQGEEGTSLYVPREEGFTCEGGPHYSFNKFKKVKTIPFTPNSLFVFKKTSASFHGVEKTKKQRDVLLFDVRRNG